MGDRTMMRQGGWIAIGGALGIVFSPDAALFAGVIIFIAGWLEECLKRRTRIVEDNGQQGR